MDFNTALLLTNEDREALWAQVSLAVEQYIRDVAEMRVAPKLDPARVRAMLAEVRFDEPMTPASMPTSIECCSRFCP